MIDSIQIQNFQSHKNTTLELSPGINAITGPSDHGKSAILRALLWAVFNRPLGDAYISSWAKDKKGKQTRPTKVTVQSQGKILNRVRDKDFNGYIIGEDNFEALRAEVPDPVKAFFNLGPVNIQRQHDPAFLISSNGIEIAKFFNEIIRLDQIDMALSLAESKRREARKEDKRITEEMDELKKSLKKFNWLGTAEILLGKIQVHLSKIQPKEETAQQLKNSLATHFEAHTILEQNMWIEVAQNKLQAAEKIKSESNYLLEAKSSLDRQTARYKEAQIFLSSVDWVDKVSDLLAEADEIGDVCVENRMKKDILASSKKAYLSAQQQLENTKSLEDVAVILAKAKVIQGKINNLTASVAGLPDSLNEWNYSTESIKSLGKSIKSLQDKMPDTCPLCGQTMPKEGGKQ